MKVPFFDLLSSVSLEDTSAFALVKCSTIVVKKGMKTEKKGGRGKKERGRQGGKGSLGRNSPCL